MLSGPVPPRRGQNLCDECGERRGTSSDDERERTRTHSTRGDEYEHTRTADVHYELEIGRSRTRVERDSARERPCTPAMRATHDDKGKRTSTHSTHDDERECTRTTDVHYELELARSRARAERDDARNRPCTPATPATHDDERERTRMPSTHDDKRERTRTDDVRYELGHSRTRAERDDTRERKCTPVMSVTRDDERELARTNDVCYELEHPRMNTERADCARALVHARDARDP